MALAGLQFRRRQGLDRNRTASGLAMCAPALTLLILFFVVPLILVVVMSTENWPLIGTATKYVGGANYSAALHDQQLGASIRFTSEYTAITTPLSLVVGYLLAVLVRKRRPGVAAFRFVYFMPLVLGFATASYMFLPVLQPGALLGHILSAVGIGTQQTAWLANRNDAMIVIALIHTWKTVGLDVLLFMAGMQAIPTELYEAAMTDGAGGLARELRITLPLLRRTIALACVLAVVGGYLAFDQFYIMTSGGPYNETITVVMWIYSIGFGRFQLGYAAAISVLMTIALLIVSSVQLRIGGNS